MTFDEVHIGMPVTLVKDVGYTIFCSGSVGVVAKLFPHRRNDVLVKFGNVSQIIHVCDLAPRKKVEVL